MTLDALCPHCLHPSRQRLPCGLCLPCCVEEVNPWWYAERPLPAPTEALPGTVAKVRVLAERRGAGLCLFHPGDARPVAGMEDQGADELLALIATEMSCRKVGNAGCLPGGRVRRLAQETA